MPCEVIVMRLAAAGAARRSWVAPGLAAKCAGMYMGPSLDVPKWRVWALLGLRWRRLQPGSDGEAGAGDDGGPADQGGLRQRFAEDQCGPCDAQHGLNELDLADLRHRADGEAPVPGEESEEHADDAEVGEGSPLRGGSRRRLLGH